MIAKEDTSGDDNDDAFKLNIACDTASDSDSDDDISDSIHSIKSMQNSISPPKSDYRPPSPPLIIKQMMEDDARKHKKHKKSKSKRKDERKRHKKEKKEKHKRSKKDKN